MCLLKFLNWLNSLVIFQFPTEKMSKKEHVMFIFLVFLLIGTFWSHVSGDLTEDKQALLDFLHNISHSHTINWSKTSQACKSWTGVFCNNDQTRVIALRLPGNSLYGPIPPNTLSRLSSLKILSLRLNGIRGPFPSDFFKLGNLTSLYLQFNKFSGLLPSDFSIWNSLSVIDFSNNDFNGSIPSSISKSTHLTSLNLANNSLSGQIPDLNIPTLQLLDLSNNNLTGVVPRSLKRFPTWAYSGNKLASENAFPPSFQVEPPNAQPKRKSIKLSEQAILGIVLGGSALGFVVIAFMMIIFYYNKGDKGGLVGKPQKKEKNSKTDVSENQDKNSKLFFFEGCTFAFDLEDLLRASAEALGKGTVGMTYKAALEDGTTLVVKRLKEVIVTKRDFEQQMQIVGNVRNENVAPLRAYYYSKDEKLMVYDYYDRGSLSAILHGKRGEERTRIDWEGRLRITIGAAKGIAHLHTQNGEKFVHGNIKASNIFINSHGYGCVSDSGLATIMSPVPLSVPQAAGYRAPEVTDTRKASHASDVYSLGVLILELLTGKSPVHATGTEEVVHLVRWVNSVVREEWTAEVFDVELLRYPNIEEQMVEMLQLGMDCVARMPEQRPKIQVVVKRLEEIRRANSESRPASDTKSEISHSTPTPPPTREKGSSSLA